MKLFTKTRDKKSNTNRRSGGNFSCRHPKLWEYIKSNVKAFFITGAIVFTISASATVVLHSKQVRYKNDKSVEQAINELYEKADELGLIAGCKGCTKLEYLESTGTQYINTNYYADKNTNAQYKVNVLEYKTFGPHLLSGRNYYFPFYRQYSDNSLVALRGGRELQLDDVDFSKNTIYEYKAYWNNEIYVNGKKVGELSDFGGKDVKPLYIGAYGGEPNDSNYKSKFRIYYYKIFDGNKLVRNYIPVIDSFGRPCLFDKVSKTCFYNQGTGEFLYG